MMQEPNDHDYQTNATNLPKLPSHYKELQDQASLSLPLEEISASHLQSFNKQDSENLENNGNEDPFSVSDPNLNEKRSVYKQNKLKRKQKENAAANQKKIRKSLDNSQSRRALGSTRGFDDNIEESNSNFAEKIGVKVDHNLDENDKKNFSNMESFNKAAHSAYSDANFLGYGSVDFQNSQSASVYNDRRQNDFTSGDLMPTVSSPTHTPLIRNNVTVHVEEEEPTTSPQQRTQSSSPQFSEFQGKLHLKRQMIYFLTTASISGLLWLMSNSYIPFELLFAAISLYWIYVIIERLRSKKRTNHQSEHWLRTEYLFTAVDAMCGIVTLILFAMKLMKVIPSSSLFPIPLLATSWVYFFKSKAPTSLKKQRTLIKTFYMFQVFLISLKLDNVIPIGWGLALIGCWIYAAIITICFALNFLFLSLVALVMVFRGRQLRICKEELTGLVWNCISYGRTLSDFVIVAGLANAYGSGKDFGLLRMGAYINITLSIMGIIYAKKMFGDLVKYIRTQITRSLVEAEEQDVQDPTDTIKHVTTIHIQKKDTYFVKVSSTYYLPLDLSFSVKSAQNLKRIKNLFTSLKSQRENRRPNKVEVGNLKDHRAIANDMLKKAKENLENKAPKSSDREEFEFDHKRVLVTTRDFNVYTEIAEEQKGIPRGHVSADNVDFIREDNIPDSKENDEESQCYLCYDQKDNAVLMDCGHGGVCYECAVAVAKSKNECMECRAPIKAVHKINPNPKFLDIVKGYEMCKVVIKTEVCNRK